MEKNTTILIIAGIIITALLWFVNVYLAGIVGILFIAIIMSVLIMKDTAGIPDVVPTLREDAKGIILTNNGNARAEKIHAVLVPSNVTFDVPSLDVDSTYEFQFSEMVQEIKIVITWSNENGRQFSVSSKLSVFGEEPDLLRPLIPMFKWKK
jgi:hypothetical protein